MNCIQIHTPEYDLYNCDCMEYMATLPDKYFDIAIVDPPYRDINDPDQWLRANSGDMKTWPPAPKKEYFDELFRISTNQIIWGGNYFTNFLEPNNNWIIWHKLNEGVHFSMCEMAWSSIKKNIQLIKLLPERDKIHPTQKPVALYDWILKNYTQPGNKVFDSHLGSMSSIIACVSNNLHIAGCEIDSDYFNTGYIRLKNFEQNSTDKNLQEQFFI